MSVLPPPPSASRTPPRGRVAFPARLARAILVGSVPRAVFPKLRVVKEGFKPVVAMGSIPCCLGGAWRELGTPEPSPGGTAQGCRVTRLTSTAQPRVEITPWCSLLLARLAGGLLPYAPTYSSWLDCWSQLHKEVRGWGHRNPRLRGSPVVLRGCSGAGGSPASPRTNPCPLPG